MEAIHGVSVDQRYTVSVDQLRIDSTSSTRTADLLRFWLEEVCPRQMRVAGESKARFESLRADAHTIPSNRPSQGGTTERSQQRRPSRAPTPCPTVETEWALFYFFLVLTRAAGFPRPSSAATVDLDETPPSDTTERHRGERLVPASRAAGSVRAQQVVGGGGCVALSHQKNQ